MPWPVQQNVYWWTFLNRTFWNMDSWFSTCLQVVFRQGRQALSSESTQDSARVGREVFAEKWKQKFCKNVCLSAIKRQEAFEKCRAVERACARVPENFKNAYFQAVEEMRRHYIICQLHRRFKSTRYHICVRLTSITQYSINQTSPFYTSCTEAYNGKGRAKMWPACYSIHVMRWNDSRGDNIEVWAQKSMNDKFWTGQFGKRLLIEYYK